MQPKITALLDLPEDELLFRIGRDIAGTGARSERREALIEKAQTWLASRSEDFRAAICPSNEVRSIMTMTSEEDRQVQLVTAVSDILSTVLIGIPPFTIAVLLVRVGLDSLCQDFTTNAPK